MVHKIAPAKVKITKEDGTTELRPLGFSFDESFISGGPLGQQIQSEGYHLGLVKFLLRSLADLYPDLPVGAFSSNAVFTVKDEDGGMVRFDSEEEFVAAMHGFQSWKSCLRVEVTVLKSAPSSDSPFPFLKVRTPPKVPSTIVCRLRAHQPTSIEEASTPHEANGPAVHTRVRCDACFVVPIVGTRYKCAVRSNFDLCEACEACEPVAGADSPFPFLKIRTPPKVPSTIVCRLRAHQPASIEEASTGKNHRTGSGNGYNFVPPRRLDGDGELPKELQHLEKAMVEKIMKEVQQRGDPVTFDQIAGLEFSKKSVVEMVCWPIERPDIFVGLRALPKGLLLFGPPGTGKTLIGKAIAHQSGPMFFSISASSLFSKWIGEGEKMVRTLFAVAAYHQPAVIFIDEVDSMLSMRSAGEHEASRRIKTELFIQLDGVGTNARDRVLVVGATNRPQELDEAARRRFVKRLYVPLPDKSGRRQLINILLKTSVNNLTPRDVEEVVEGTEGFSGADLHSLCAEAAMGPVRELGSSICSIKASDVPPMEARHFTYARQCMRPSVGAEEITHYVAWNEEFGSFKRH
ncbi:unnamed protein product [Ascophyllum nodosum]